MTRSAGTTVIAPCAEPEARGVLTLVLARDGDHAATRYLLSCAHVLRRPGGPAAAAICLEGGERIADKVAAVDLAARPEGPDVGIAQLLHDVDPRLPGGVNEPVAEDYVLLTGDDVRIVLPRAPQGIERKISAVNATVEMRTLAQAGAEVRYRLQGQAVISGDGLTLGDSGAPVVIVPPHGLVQFVGMFVGFDKDGRGVVTPIGAVLAAARALADEPRLQPLLDLTPMRIDRVIPPVPDPPVPDGQPLFRLVQAAEGRKLISGPAILALQVALRGWAVATAADGIAGPSTLTAWKTWLDRQGRPNSDEVSLEDWRLLLGGPGSPPAPPPSPFDLCLGVTAAFEGTEFGRVVGNFDGAGITFGLIGFNVKWGSLGKLIAEIDARDAGLVGGCFGSLENDLRAMLAADDPDARVALAQAAQDGVAGIRADWSAAFAKLGAQAAAREAQLAVAWDYWVNAKAFWNDICPGERASLLDMGLCLDICVQNGRPGAERLPTYRSRAIGSGAARRQAVAETCAGFAKERWRADVLARKSTFVDGIGTVHQGGYRLADWGLTDHPLPITAWDAPTALNAHLAAPPGATPAPEQDDPAGTGAGQPATEDAVVKNRTSPHAGWPLYRDFLAFFDGLRLSHFKADEVLIKGGGHFAGPCAGTNGYPDPSLWRNIGPTLAVLQSLRDEFGPIHITSAFRHPDYNECLRALDPDVARNSQHMHFRALDFVCENKQPHEVEARLAQMREAGEFTGWFRAYPAEGFTHLDTRGHRFPGE